MNFEDQYNLQSNVLSLPAYYSSQIQSFQSFIHTALLFPPLSKPTLQYGVSSLRQNYFGSISLSSGKEVTLEYELGTQSCINMFSYYFMSKNFGYFYYILICWSIQQYLNFSSTKLKFTDGLHINLSPLGTGGMLTITTV